MTPKVDGYYYLHTHGPLIFKRNGDPSDFRESDLVRMFWPFDSDDRYTVWRICVEALALGCDCERISQLAALWQCDDKDAVNFANHFGVQLYMDGDQWCAVKSDHVDLRESPAGFGYTCLEAMAGLLKECGFKPCKTWGHTIKDLLQVAA